MSEIIQLPENGGNGWNGGLPFSIPVGNIGNNNGNGFLGGCGGGVLGFLLGAMINNNGGGLFGNGGGNVNNANAMLLSNAQNYLAQAITNQGETTRSAVQSLSTMLGQDFNLVNSNVQTITQAVNQMSNAQGMSALQIINAIQSGDANLASQLCQCCCQNQKDILQQTNTFLQGLNGVQQAIASKAAADQLSTCQQTYALTDTMNRNYQQLDNKIDAMESSRKDREITALTAKVAQLESQNYTANLLGQALAPVNAQLSGIRGEVDAIKRCQPATVTLPDNSMTAVPTIWANAVADNIVARISSAITAAGGTTTDGGAAATMIK